MTGFVRRWEDFGAKDIPDEIQQRLQAAASTEDRATLIIGEETATLLAALEAEGVEVPRMRLYKAVGAWARCSAETVRMALYLYTRVPRDVWDENPDLGVHHFKTLAPHCNGAEEFRRTIDRWREHCAQAGYGPTVDSLAAFLMAPGQTREPAVLRLHRLERTMERMISDQTVPKDIRTVLRRALLDLRRVARPPWRTEA